ncbi:MAG: PIG-L family deacetylase [Desulfobacterota bacterium]|nr:PIG-L family deacetylase [Thermodesulfobacteriota bacterium]
MTVSADILVIGPHPDDAEISAGGSIAFWCRNGKQVVLAVCTSGERGTADRSITPEHLAMVREQEQRDAAAVLGIHEVIFLRYPDQGLEDTPAFRQDIVRLIRTYRPTTIVTCDPYRRYLYHRDHRITGQVVCDAVFPYARDHLAYPDLLEEGLEPHKVRELLFWSSEDINYRIDITATFAIKLAALRCHQSQLAGLESDNLETWVRRHAEEMAAGEPYALAEAFHRIEIIR